MALEVGGRADLRDLEPFHFVLRETLLHAETDEVLAQIGQPPEDLEQRQHLRTTLLIRVVLDCVDQAARALDVRNPHEKFFINHLESAHRSHDQHHSQVEQVLLPQFLERDL